MRPALSAAVLLLAGLPAEGLAQFDAYGQPLNPYSLRTADPRSRRANRERAVSLLGPKARNFVEMEGDEAVAAIFTCSREAAAKLVAFYASGRLDKLPRPRDLLRVIAQPRHGDDVALWAMEHAGELADPDSFDAYVMTPLEYAMELKDLELGAAEMRARRDYVARPTVRLLAMLLANDKLVLGGVGVLALIALYLWRRKRSEVY
jgi:hypothetical protein